jgi:hypothetical protein
MHLILTPILSRCLGVLADKVTQNTAIEDKKIKKELQVSVDIYWFAGADFLKDHYGKLLDSCVVYVGRSTDQGSWIRRSTKETILSTGSGRESPAPRAGKWYICVKMNADIF